MMTCAWNICIYTCVEFNIYISNGFHQQRELRQEETHQYKHQKLWTMRLYILLLQVSQNGEQSDKTHSDR